MKTDALFYELFRLEPQSLFDLVRLKMEGDYAFESITVKTIEKRCDGFLKRTDNQGPNVFLEVQGYDDPGIYWRLFREVCAWYEQSDSSAPFLAIVLFTDARYVPKECPFVHVAPPHQFFQYDLADCLKALGDNSGPLTVLKPLVLEDKRQLPELVPQWKAEIDALAISAEKAQCYEELLEYAILQRFPQMTLKEVQQMIQLTPLEKTVAVQELILMSIQKGKKEGKKEGKEEGKEEGLKKGELIGEIRAFERILKQPQSHVDELVQKSLKELRVILKRLKSEL
jgi:predicted transposase YdaD